MYNKVKDHPYFKNNAIFNNHEEGTLEVTGHIQGKDF